MEKMSIWNRAKERRQPLEGRKGKEIFVFHLLTAKPQKIPLRTLHGPLHSILPPALPHKTSNTYSGLGRDTKELRCVRPKLLGKGKDCSMLALPST